MHRTTRWMGAVAVAVAIGLPLTACSEVPASTHKTVEPVKVEPIGNTGVKRLTLEDKAVERLGITTFPIVAVSDVALAGRGAAGAAQPAAAAPGTRTLMPYAALMYLPDGTTFAYTNPEGSTYVRETVSVESIQGEMVVLSAGPPVGTRVVTTGGAELWGAEFGIK